MAHDEDKWHDTLQQLRIQLRRAMDGETSSHQRNLGLEYKINFGVNILRLKAIAETLPNDQELADLMWSKDVREMKLLSLFLRQPSTLTTTEALKLTSEVPTLEVAEQLVFRLLRFVPFAPSLLSTLFEQRYAPNTPPAVVPYLLLNHLTNDERLTPELFDRLSPMIIEDFSECSKYLPTIIYNALQRIVYNRPDLNVRTICEEVCSKGDMVVVGLATDIITIIEEQGV